MIVWNGVAFGLLLTAVGAFTVVYADWLSAVHARVISNHHGQDAGVADGMRSVLLVPMGATVALFGAFIAASALVN